MATLDHLIFSHHAEKRLQGRGVTKDDVSSVILYGEEIHRGDGDTAYFMSRNSVETALRQGVDLSNLENFYVVVSNDSVVVTVYRRYKSLHKDDKQRGKRRKKPWSARQRRYKKGRKIWE
jgi:hypothetical protein